MKKYKLTGETINLDGHPLHRIQALKDFGDVKAGELGGFVGSRQNLSQEGNAWIYDNARVYGNTKVFDNARVYGSALVSDNVMVFGNACLYGDIFVSDNARIYGHATVSGKAVIQKEAEITQERDYFTMGPIGSRCRTTTFYRTANGIYVACGCFNDSIEEFAKAVVVRHKESQHARDYQKAIELAKMMLEVKED